MSVVLLASTSASATSIIDYSFAKQQLQKITPELRSRTCKTFNKEVMAINRFIKDNDLPTKLVSNNLCTYIHVSKGQLEDTLSFDNIRILDKLDAHVDTLHEKVEVSQEIEMIVFAEPEVTQYLYYSDVNAILRSQKFKSDSNKKGVMFDPFDAGITAGVFNRSASHILAVDADCSQVSTKITCVPGGRSNSRYWILDHSSPINSTDNATVFQTETTSMGFNFELTAGASKSGPSAPQVGTGFDFNTSTSNGSERKAVNVVTVKEPNDLGIKATWYLDPSVISAAPMMGWSSLYPMSYARSDKYFGASAYRDLDLSSSANWREMINKSNCNPEPGKNNRDIKFISNLYIERGAYDLESSGSSAHWDYGSDSSFKRKNLSHSVKVRTQCQTDALGNLMRVVRPGILN